MPGSNACVGLRVTIWNRSPNMPRSPSAGASGPDNQFTTISPRFIHQSRNDLSPLLTPQGHSLHGAIGRHLPAVRRAAESARRTLWASIKPSVTVPSAVDLSARPSRIVYRCWRYEIYQCPMVPYGIRGRRRAGAVWRSVQWRPPALMLPPDAWMPIALSTSLDCLEDMLAQPAGSNGEASADAASPCQRPS